MTGIKRLSPRQSRKVNTLVKKECCNCENGNCILLDDGDTCVCPQLISYSLLCKWFRIAVLPLDKLLYAELYQTEDRKSDFAKAGQKKNAANCDVSNCFFYEETRELYSPVISLLASSIPFAVADRIFKSFSLMPLSMVSS